MELDEKIDTTGNTNDTITRVQLGDREIVIVGTAHISQESVKEVKDIIHSEKPDRVCVEIDESRFQSLTQKQTWSNLDIIQVLKQGKGFMLLANLVLASFQRRLGMDLGIKPGEEMLAAITTAQELGIPFSLCDREIQITLRRAWAKSNFWGKNKMLAALVSAALTKEKLTAEEIEELKKKSMMHNMLEEVAAFLPSAKSVLIDERDIYLATKVFAAEGKKLVAVVGAGHVPGMVRHLNALQAKQVDTDLTEISNLPPKNKFSQALPWLISIAIVGVIAANFFFKGSGIALNNIIKWVILNGGGAALGSLLAMAHPVTILLAFVAAPIATLHPLLAVGMFTGILEAGFRKPRVSDFENLHEDILSFKGVYKNRVTHVLVVFFLSSLGGMIGNWIGLVPFVSSLVGK